MHDDVHFIGIYTYMIMLRYALLTVMITSRIFIARQPRARLCSYEGTIRIQSPFLPSFLDISCCLCLLTCIIIIIFFFFLFGCSRLLTWQKWLSHARKKEACSLGSVGDQMPRTLYLPVAVRGGPHHYTSVNYIYDDLEHHANLTMLRWSCIMDDHPISRVINIRVPMELSFLSFLSFTSSTLLFKPSSALKEATCCLLRYCHTNHTNDENSRMLLNWNSSEQSVFSHSIGSGEITRLAQWVLLFILFVYQISSL